MFDPVWDRMMVVCNTLATNILSRWDKENQFFTIAPEITA